MGNIGSNGGGRRRTHSVHGDHRALAPPHALHPPPPPPTQPDVGGGGNRYVFAAASPYPPQYPNPPPPPYYHYPGYFPAPPPPPPFLHRGPHDPHVLPPPPPPWGRYGPGMPPAPIQAPPPYIEHQKAVTIRNDVNIKKETLRVEPDEGSPGKFLVAFTFDATTAGSITVVFFAKEGIECNLMPMKESLLPPVSVSFEKGLSQKFRQPSGSGIDFSIFNETELSKEGEMEVYPLAVKAETCSDDQGSTRDNQQVETTNSQITQAIFEKKDIGEYHAKVVKQILWLAGVRYELQEIYGIGNSVDNEFDGNDPGKECVICLSEPRDTTVLPCRHMCMCSECAKVLRFQTNRCPICRQPVERLLEIKVNNKTEVENGSVPVD